MGRSEIVNFLRGYSIFTIALMHLLAGSVSGVFSKVIAFGGAGVHVFILCSGFGLYLSYLKKPVGYTDFLRRRFTKVWLPYAIAVLMWAVWLYIQDGVFPLWEALSHWLLYKMFFTELDTSLCYPYWFISTILQFYLFWPLIVKAFKQRLGGWLLLVISLAWSTFVGIMGLEEMRPYGSFFLQYLWEFGLGMWIAEQYVQKDYFGKPWMVVKSLRWWWLILGAGVGMGLSSFMAWNGGILKLYNDIPSLLGYLSLALIVYKLGVVTVNRFFEWTNDFSYELYLLHTLVYAVVAILIGGKIPLLLLWAVSLLAAYFVAYCYRLMTKNLYSNMMIWKR